MKKFKNISSENIIRSRHFHLLSFILLLALILFSGGLQSFCELKKCTIKFSNSDGHDIRVDVEIAATESQREKGLMHRTSLPEDSGMLFVFEQDRRLSFWMKNTYIPLDIAFIDSKGVITDIMQMRPLDTSVFYSSSTEVRYALEMNQWWFKKHGIKPGSRIGLSGCIGK